MSKSYFNLFSRCLDEIFPLEDEVKKEIYTAFSWHKIPKKKYFINEGCTNNYLGIVVSGLFCSSFSTNSSKEYIKQFLAEKDFLLGNVDSKKNNRISIRALEDSFIFRADYKKIEYFCDKISSMDRLRFFLVSKYWGMVEDRLISLLSNSAGENYAEFRKNYSHLEKRIPLKYIASYLGITPTQLSRLKK